MNAFSSYHPAALLLYFIGVLLSALLTKNPVMLGLALLGGVSFRTLLERPPDFWRNLGFYLPLYLMIAVVNPLFSHNGVTPLFFLNGNPVTLEAILYGLTIAVMAVALLYWLTCCTRVMTSDKVLFLFGKLLPRLSLLLSTALRFIPLFKAQMKKVHRAQKAMGLYAGNSYVDKLRGGLRVFAVMLTWSMENAIDMGDSMKARGYGLKGRSHFALFRFTLRDALLLGATVTLLGLTLLGLLCKMTSFTFYPRITVIRSTPLALAAYIAFGALSFLPFIIELEENLKWTYYRSRI